MPSFSELPSELAEQIVSYLAQREIYAISQLTKALYTLAIPWLYRHVDLVIPPGEKVPRIDRLCLNILTETKRAKYIKALRLGISAREGVRDGQRWVPKDKSFPEQLFCTKAMEFLQGETLVANGDDIREGLAMRDYGAYATLIVLALPSLRCLEIADLDNAALQFLNSVLSSLARAHSEGGHATDALLARISSIEEISYSFDRMAGVQYPYRTTNAMLRAVLGLPSIQKLEIFIPDQNARRVSEAIMPRRPPLNFPTLSTNITTIIIRHSTWASYCIEALLHIAPQLKSLTCELWYDTSKTERAPADANTPWINLLTWADYLKNVKDTLTTLNFSVEYCDTSQHFYKQPAPEKEIFGYLDLTVFERLHTLEVPLAFITGDASFSITREFYPLLPPNLHHLSLRTDITHAQSPFPFDQSILTSSPTFAESSDEARYLMGARMDLSYTFQASLSILDHASTLESFTIWQPADPSLEWFDGQIADFATMCKNKNVKAKLVYPMLLRWKRAEHWDLVREVTLFDPRDPGRGRYEEFWRGAREGVPLGLATQFHLFALRSGKVLIGR